jgi:pimeloyl-ACP methyl ester carboxylesterase
MRNDLFFWGEENSDPGLADRIDATRVPLYLYSGEYDFTCPPAAVEESARRIGEGIHYEMLEGLGHFPMSEDYAIFRPTLVKTLEAITFASESSDAAA